MKSLSGYLPVPVLKVFLGRLPSGKALKPNIQTLLIALFSFSNITNGSAQNFTASLTGNPVSTTGWTFPSGTSYVSGNSFVLTNATTTQAGYIYYNTTANLSSCADFSVSFEFQITNNSFPPADGLTFYYISNPPAGFTNGSGLGLPLNPDGLVLLFDTYDNNSTPDNPLIALAGFSGGQNYLEGSATGILGSVNNQNYLTDGNWHICTLTYNSGNITVNVDGNNLITAFYPLNQTGYFGFSASTGALWSKHSVRNVSISGTLPPAAPTVVSPVVYCQNEPASPLTATASAGLNWYTSASGGSPLAAAPTPNTSVVATTTWYVSTQGVNGCESARVPITVTVNAKPGFPLGTHTYTYCQGDAVIPFSFTGQNLQWYQTASGGTAMAGAPVITTGTSVDSTWYISQTINGCESDRLPVHVTVAAKPPAPVVVTPVIYCAGDTPQPLSASGQTLRWYSVPQGGFSSAITPVPNTSIQGNETWYVSQTIDGCQSDRAQIDVTTNQTPNALIVPNRASVCLHDTLSFTYFGSASPAANYTWTFPADASLISGSGQGPLIVRFDTVGIKRISLIVDYLGCKSPLVYQDITVSPIPQLEVTSKKDACVNEPVEIALTHVTEGINHYEWDFNGGTIAYGGFGSELYGIQWANPGQYYVSIKGISDVCPSLTYIDTIDVHPLPVSGISGAPATTICTGDTIALTALYKEGYQFQWLPSQFIITDGLPSVKAVVDFTGYVSLITTDIFNCRSRDSVMVNTMPCCEVGMPSAFSPNGDGKNDLFHVVSAGHHQLKAFRVMNRWGQTVFETADETRGWDGTFNQEPQDPGTFFYYLRYVCSNGVQYEKKGEVVLVR